MYIIGGSIISSLGFTTEENYDAVKQGISGIKHYESGIFGLPEPFMAALINKERLQDEFSTALNKNRLHYISTTALTSLEIASILSVLNANKEMQIDLSNNRTIFILSSTKGNIEFLDMRLIDMKYEIANNLNSQIYLWRTAELIAEFFGNPNTPIVISNACISGAAAQIVAMRSLQSRKYDYAVVVGVDLLSKFIISGFQSFKALSSELCKPFDKNRSGLNLGEAAATMIMSNEQLTMNNGVRLVVGAIRNDATHISAPSRIGEGSYRALQAILTPLTSHLSPLTSQIAFINAHGTATSYNDAMEMNAIVRTGLENVPVNGLKGYFGHTLGAAGLVETIISMQALSDGIVLKTLGFEENEQLTINDEQFSLMICRENIQTDKKYFIKMMSGFGGVNVALLYENIATNYNEN